MFELRGCSHFITYSGINSSAHQLLQRPFQLANQIEQLIKRTIIFNYPAGMNILSGFWLFPIHFYGEFIFFTFSIFQEFSSLFFISVQFPPTYYVSYSEKYSPLLMLHHLFTMLKSRFTCLALESVSRLNFVEPPLTWKQNLTAPPLSKIS